MNALQRLQETQETLQGVAARLRIDIAGLTVPELAGVVATEAIKLHDELVHARSSLADMERQRDEARKRASALEDEYADSDGQWKDATGLLVGGDPDGVTPGHLRRHIQRADRTIAAWKRCAKQWRRRHALEMQDRLALQDQLRQYEEADTKPRERVEEEASDLDHAWELIAAEVAKVRDVEADIDPLPVIVRRIARIAQQGLATEEADELATLRARVEAKEAEVQKERVALLSVQRNVTIVLEQRDRAMQQRDEARARAEKAERELVQMRAEHRECDQIMTQRDQWEEQVGDMAAQAGCQDEFSNAHDHRECVAERFAILKDQRDKAIERATKAEQELARVNAAGWTDNAKELILRQGDELRSLKAELARFQRADVGERARRIEARHADGSARTPRPNLAIHIAERRFDDRAELLSIVRQQAAEIERLTSEAKP